MVDNCIYQMVVKFRKANGGGYNNGKTKADKYCYTNILTSYVLFPCVHLHLPNR